MLNKNQSNFCVFRFGSNLCVLWLFNPVLVQSRFSWWMHINLGSGRRHQIGGRLLSYIAARQRQCWSLTPVLESDSHLIVWLQCWSLTPVLESDSHLYRCRGGLPCHVGLRRGWRWDRWDDEAGRGRISWANFSCRQLGWQERADSPEHGGRGGGRPEHGGRDGIRSD